MLNVRKRSPRDNGQFAGPKRPKLPTGGSRTLRYEGPEGYEALVEVIHCDGRITTHEGPKGEERMVTTKWDDGPTWHFDGERGAEHLVKIERANKNRTDFFEGGHGQEVLRRTEWTDGRVRYWGGDRCIERKLRTTYPGGGMRIYTGGWKQERLMAFQAKDDSFVHHVGVKGEERGWLRVSGGAAQLWDVHGRVTHSVLSDGKVLFHSKDGAETTYMPSTKYQSLKAEVNGALNKLSELNEAGHCNDQTMVVLSNALRSIHSHMEHCCVHSSGTVNDQSEPAVWSEIESEDEQECVNDNNSQDVENAGASSEEEEEEEIH